MQIKQVVEVIQDSLHDAGVTSTAVTFSPNIVRVYTDDNAYEITVAERQG